MHEDDTEEIIRAQRDLLQLYRDFIAEVRALRIELEAEMARLRAITKRSRPSATSACCSESRV
jgi:hypothetical protein